MADAANGTKAPGKGGAIAVAITATLAAVFGGLGIYLRQGAVRAEGDVERFKREYDQMVRMKRQVDEFRKNTPRLPAVDKGSDDLLQLLGPKARQANIPQNVLTITRNPDRKEGGWKEVSYTVTLRAASKESPILVTSLADFLSLVEKERPDVKAKNLSLAYNAENFSTASVTFSLFKREAP